MNSPQLWQLSGAELLLRQRLLAFPTRVPDAHDIELCAELAREIGATDGARSLHQLTSLHRGYGAQASRRRGVAAARMGSCGAGMPVPTIADAAERGGSQTMRAVGALAAAMTAHTPPVIPQTMADMALQCEADETLIGEARGLCAALDGALSDPNDKGMEAVVARLADVVSAARVNMARSVDAPTDRLIDLYLLRGLQDFLDGTHELLFAPLGSAALLHRVARLGDDGLGAYCRNVGRIVVDGGDLIGIAALSAEEGGADATTVERWVALLASRLAERRLLELIDALADAGWTGALWAILGSAKRRMVRDDESGPLYRLRDSAADIGAIDLAIAAQSLVATRVSHNAFEWALLGDLRATAGDVAAAKADYAHALSLAVNDSTILARIDALEAGDLAALEVVGGFASPRGVKRRRLRQAGVLPPDPKPMADLIGA